MSLPYSAASFVTSNPTSLPISVLGSCSAQGNKSSAILQSHIGVLSISMPIASNLKKLWLVYGASRLSVAASGGIALFESASSAEQDVGQILPFSKGSVSTGAFSYFR